MKTEESPEMTMATIKRFLSAGGKFLLMFSADQSSKKTEQKRRMGIDRRLL